LNSLSIDLRPRHFEDVVGHAKVIASIRKTLSDGRISKGWIFSGPSGTGKTTLAKIVARIINNADDDNMELVEVNAADNNGVDYVRSLVESASYRPFRGERKVYILDEAQQLTQQAQNVLLNPLENPDNSSVWMFCTTEPAKIIPALKTRCLSYALSNISAAEMTVLIDRATDHLGVDKLPGFAAAAFKYGLGPRAALQALEKHLGGMDLRESLAQPEHEPLYADVAKAVLRGDWTKTAEILDKVKSADVGGLRSVIAAFFRSEIVKGGWSPRNDAISGALLAMGQFTAVEPGVSYGITTAILYKLSKSLQSK
jgi:energy-coupling factor transporter ATP-binding protein EcfA2